MSPRSTTELKSTSEVGMLGSEQVAVCSSRLVHRLPVVSVAPLSLTIHVPVGEPNRSTIIMTWRTFVSPGAACTSASASSGLGHADDSAVAARAEPSTRTQPRDAATREPASPCSPDCSPTTTQRTKPPSGGAFAVARLLRPGTNVMSRCSTAELRARGSSLEPRQADGPSAASVGVE